MKIKNSFEFFGGKYLLSGKLTSKSIALDLITILDDDPPSRKFFREINTQSEILLSQFGTVKELFHFMSFEKNLEVDYHLGRIILKWSVSGFNFERMVTHEISLEGLELSREKELEYKIFVLQKNIEKKTKVVNQEKGMDEEIQNEKEKSEKGSLLRSEFHENITEKDNNDYEEQKGMKERESISNKEMEDYFEIKRNCRTPEKSEVGSKHEKKDDLFKPNVIEPEENRAKQVEKQAKMGEQKSSEKENEKMEQESESIESIRNTPKKRGRPPKLNKMIGKEKLRKKEKESLSNKSENLGNQIRLCSNVEKRKETMPNEEPSGTKLIEKGKNFEKIQIEGNRVRILYKSGDVYEGEMNNRVYEGYGVYTSKDERRYEGFWLKGFYHGKGSLSFPDGTKFSGNFEFDERVGEGEETYKNGDRFVGNFVNGVKHGFGKYYFFNGDIYEGEFKNDVVHGHGTELMNDGSEYEGIWSDGKRHGEGTIRYKNNKNFFRESWENGVLRKRKNIKGKIGYMKIKEIDDEDDKQL